MSFPCPILNPCPCNKCLCSPVPPCPGKPECCLRACSAIIACDDAVGPCGQAGSFDLTTLDHTTTGCSGPVIYSLYSHDDFFPSVTITQAGLLTWVTPGPEFVDEYGMITFRITCATECDECIGTLDSLGCITIGVANLCQGVICNPNETCNPCDGTCDPVPVDLEITTESPSVDLSIQS